MSWEDVCHWIAQGAVNISEGHTTIEADSRVHRAMNAFCEYVQSGRVKIDDKTMDERECRACGSTGEPVRKNGGARTCANCGGA